MERKKQIINFIFSIAFLLMITIPLCLLRTEPEIASELENRNLTEWPGLHFSALYNEWYGHYAEDRIGFRDQAIRFNNLVYQHRAPKEPVRLCKADLRLCKKERR